MIEIRPMAEDYILDRCYQRRPWNPHDPNDPSSGVLGTSCGALGELRFGPEWQAFHRSLIERFGNGAFIAWDGNHIVGWVNFFPKGIAQEYNSREVPHDSQLRDEALVIGCLQVVFDPAYQGKGIGSRLVRETVEFARSKGFERLEVHSVHSGRHPFLWYWSERSGRPFWEGLGFQVLRQSSPRETAATRRSYEQIPERYQDEEIDLNQLADLLSRRDWEEVFRTYSMAHWLEGEDA